MTDTTTTGSQPTKAWVDGPFHLITSEKTGDSTAPGASSASKVAAEMTIVHNCLIRGVNAIYNQVSNVAARGSDKDKLDFADFAIQWARMLHEHHHSEETLIFPEINEITKSPGLMDANVEEHKLFHAGLDEFQGYLARVKVREEALDGARLKAIVDGFMPQLREHLDNEIDTLLGLRKFEDEIDWAAWFQTKTSKIVSGAFKTAEFRNDLFPLTMVLHDKSFEEGVWATFPPMPWIMHVALRWLFMGTRKDWWRFAGCDYYSLPQELPFA